MEQPGLSEWSLSAPQAEQIFSARQSPTYYIGRAWALQSAVCGVQRRAQLAALRPPSFPGFYNAQHPGMHPQ
jgi:hypothetical protein